MTAFEAISFGLWCYATT